LVKEAASVLGTFTRKPTDNKKNKSRKVIFLFITYINFTPNPSSLQCLTRSLQILYDKFRDEKIYPQAIG
jgi:hypothetical protein